MRATRLLPGIVLLVGALLAGCSSPTPGTPTPAAPVASTPADPPELALDGVDPCSLITEADRQTFGLGEATATSTPGGFPICRWKHQDVTFQITAVIGANPADYMGYSERHSDLQVDGYPALQMQQPGAASGESCIVSVGVKPNHVVQILIGDRFTGSYVDDAAICSEAIRFAHTAIATLQRH